MSHSTFTGNSLWGAGATAAVADLGVDGEGLVVDANAASRAEGLDD